MESNPRTAKDQGRGNGLPAKPTRGRVPPPLLPGAERRSVLRALIRSLLSVTGLVVVYYLLPLDRRAAADRSRAGRCRGDAAGPQDHPLRDPAPARGREPGAHRAAVPADL